MIITAVFIGCVATRFLHGEPATHESKLSGWNKWLRATLAGLIAGFMSGFLGIGGGVVLVPILVILLGFGMHEAVGTSLLAISIYAVPGTVEHYLLSHIDVSLPIPIAVAAIIGAQVGARFAMKTQEKRLRLAFALFLIAIALYLGISELL
jgi:hypothetical protein